MSIHRDRVSRATALMGEHSMDAIILVKPANMYYLVGDGRLCAYAMITRSGEVGMGVPETDLADVRVLADFDHLAGFDDEVGMIHSIAHYFKQFGIQEGTVGVEYAFLPKPRMGMLIHPHAKPEAVEPVDCTPLMSKLRLVKDAGEIERLQAAARVADAGMQRAIERLRPGMTESQVAGEAEYAMRQEGAENFYRTYVASGPRTNVAHGTPTDRKLQRGDLVMIDVHPVVNGYASDLGRTVCLGQPTAEQETAWRLYVVALEQTIAKAATGVDMAELEGTMHGVFEAAGHKEHIFGPPIHGVGIEFEESPLPAGHAFFHGEPAPPPLAAGVTIAIGNCGLYTGAWGVREEDTVVVGDGGPRVLTRHPRQLHVAV